MPHRFDPFGVDEPGDQEEETLRRLDANLLGGGPLPPRGTIEQFIQAAGIVGDGEQIQFIGIAVGVSSMPGVAGRSLSWDAGDPLPHTSRTFDDPPFAYTPSEWRDMLIRGVSLAEDEDDFTFDLKASLGQDMIHSHHVPVDTAIDGCGEFAAWLWSEFRTVP
jgi:hypothetical protein